FSRKTFAALAASGIALVATLLAASVPEQLLDPRIKGLAPVLRSNYWLTIHVLTIVSSYAAFALAMGLGLLAVRHYLAATYRRPAPFRTLAAPLVPGLLLLVPGLIGLGRPMVERADAWYLACVVTGIGGVLALTSAFAMLGEATNRALGTTLRS